MLAWNKYRRDDGVDSALASLSVSTTSTLLAAGGTGIYNDIISLTVANVTAGAVTTIFDGLTTGTPRAVFVQAANTTDQFFFDPPLKQASPATAWGVESELAVRLTIQYVPRRA